jgi:RNA polymerase sigma factor (sigma-70 family)
MQSQTGPTTGELAPAAAAREQGIEYRRLLAILSSRAQRFGSRDPEAAAQEAFVRSWENEKSQAALEYYFREQPNINAVLPSWSLDQLLAWLHTVLRYVVSEERSRAAHRLEVSFDRFSDTKAREHVPEPREPSADQLQQLLQRELNSILTECFPRLEARYRTVLRMRGLGMKYEDIAARLGEKENTVATWLSRAVRDLAKCVKRRTKYVGKNE